MLGDRPVTVNVCVAPGSSGVGSPSASVADAKFSVWLGFIAPEEGALIRSVLLSVDFFSIWSYVLIVMGLMHVFEMPKRQAIYCIIPLWIIQVLFMLIGEVTGGY